MLTLNRKLGTKRFGRRGLCNEIDMTTFTNAFQVVFMLGVGVMWIWALVDCLRNPRLRNVEKLTWVLVILFLNFIGAGFYFAIGRNPRR